MKEIQHLINSVSEDRIPSNFLDSLITLNIEILPEGEKKLSNKRKRKEEYKANKEGGKTQQGNNKSKKQTKLDEKKLIQQTKKELQNSSAEFDIKHKKKYVKPSYNPRQEYFLRNPLQFSSEF